ncbi:MAG: ABC transporter permease [Gemmatimonadaceae bacterium]|nr:ABC transporter permease [Gemmatimonadaceae bacterium]
MADGAGSRRAGRAIGATLVCVVIVAAMVGPVIAPYHPFVISGGALLSPSRDHIMGTDAVGRDVFSAVLHGARSSLVVATAVSVIALALGVSIGLVSGYRGGWIDDLLSRLTELFQVIPRFFFVITAIAIMGPGRTSLIVVIGLTSWPTLARVVRGETLVTRRREFVVAAEALGASPWRVMHRQLLPMVLPVSLAALGVLFGQVLLLEATIGFLGLGDPEAISWGMMAAQAQGFLRIAWWLALFPGLAITITVLGVNLLAASWASDRAAA